MTPTDVRCRTSSRSPTRSDKVGWALLWLLGVPLPVLLGIYALKGCS